MISVENLVKRYGPVAAVDDLTFTAQAGRVTGFLGPNGSGKSTSLRVLLGLVNATSGAARIGGRRYADLPSPTHQVGAVLEARATHPGMTGRNHLRVRAAAARIDPRRVDVVLDLVGLTAAGDRRTRGYSLGMHQRLAVATALLGDPEVLVLDEPANGLDPEGVRWLRTLLRRLAADGRTVLVSSHLLSEVALTVDDVVIIRSGRLVRQGPLTDLGLVDGAPRVRVRSVDPERLAVLLTQLEPTSVVRDGDTFLVTGADAERIGLAAADTGVPLLELTPDHDGLEEAFLRLTGTNSSTTKEATR